MAHNSIAPEPFGRVIVEAMLCGKLAIASAAGGAIDLVEHGVTGFLVPPGEPEKLADVIKTCRNQPEYTTAIARSGQIQASDRLNVKNINQQIKELLEKIETNRVSVREAMPDRDLDD